MYLYRYINTIIYIYIYKKKIQALTREGRFFFCPYNFTSEYP